MQSQYLHDLQNLLNIRESLQNKLETNKDLGKFKYRLMRFFKREGFLALYYAYKNGMHGLPKDQEQAIYWLEQAAQHDGKAAMELGDLYIDGDGVLKDTEKATYWLTQAAEKGIGIYYLGDRYMSGRGIPKDIDKAIYWWTQAAQQGETSAARRLGGYYADSANTDKATQWLTHAVEQGDSLAAIALGERYADGNGFPQDSEKAIYWLVKAHEMNEKNGDAALELGQRYADGNGLPQDSEKAIYWLTQATKNESYAAWVLGERYADGKGIPRNPEKAVYWFTQANQKEPALVRTKKENSPEEFFVTFRKIGWTDWLLGNRYAEGDGIPQNSEKALEFLTKAAHWFGAEVMWQLGERYSYGHGFPKDKQKAEEWFVKAANHNADEEDNEWKWKLGLTYLSGTSIDQNMEKAEYWLKKCEENNPSNLNRVGLFYYRLGDITKAEYWLLKAAQNGNTGAIETLNSKRFKFQKMLVKLGWRK